MAKKIITHAITWLISHTGANTKAQMNPAIIASHVTM